MNEKPKLIVVLSRFPYPLEKGDKLRSYYQIKELSKRFTIFLIALTDRVISEEDKNELNVFCTSISIYKLSKWSTIFNSFIALLGTKPIQVGYFYNYMIYRKITNEIDMIQPNYIFSQLIRTTEYTKNYHACPKVLDYMDALSKGMERRIENAPWYKKWFYKTEYKRLLAYERVMFDYFDKKTIISEQDKKFIFHPDRSQIVCIPNGIDSRFFEQLESKKEYDFSFVGNMSYPPNIEAAQLIAQSILPHFPNSKLLIAGANPHPKVEKLTKTNPNITVSGWVDDIRMAYLSSKIFIAPMQTGTGMQNKLLEAMALGIPCITSTLANNAIGAINKESIFVCDTIDEINSQINQLLQNDDERERVGKNGRKFVEANYSWENTTANLI